MPWLPSKAKVNCGREKARKKKKDVAYDELMRALLLPWTNYPKEARNQASEFDVG